MEVELSAEAKDKRVNRTVAISVVLLSVTMGLGHIKDSNLVQRMSVAKADQVDAWNEYQATRIKARVVEVARTQSSAAGPALDASLAKYAAETPKLQRQAQMLAERYEALDRRHEQFDLAEAGLTIALSVAAVAALIESWQVLAVAWLFGGFGVLMTVAAFAQLPLHPDALIGLVG